MNQRRSVYVILVSWAILVVGMAGYLGLAGCGAAATATPAPTPTTAPAATTAPTAAATDIASMSVSSSPTSSTAYEERLAACNAFPNHSTQNVIETSRLSIKLPKDVYSPQDNKLEFRTASGTATAGWISNAGPAGQSYGTTAECWAYYYEFDGSGEVDLTATSSIKGVPDYLVRFIVSPVYGDKTILYRNDQYGFSVKLPETWRGYSVLTGEWTGYPNDSRGNHNTEKGPQVLIRNPQWTSENHWQPIPIMVFTLDQWNALQQGKFLVSAAPVGPAELGRNARYVFALPARYNVTFPMGWEEVDAIMKTHPLRAF